MHINKKISDITINIMSSFNFKIGHNNLFNLFHNSNIYLINTGYHIFNWVFQWCIDWEPYWGIEGWRQQTGAIELGHDVSNHNAVPIAEFPSRQIGGNSSGKVI